MQDGVPAPDPTTPEGEHLIHRDNTFGTPEEDAFRRDFTINALFYDIATFSIIDYVGGLDDLRAGLVRSIGDPDVRLKEDPVRMIRAVALAARLDFTIEPTLLDVDPRASARDRARARRRGCSRSTTRFCAPARRRRRSAASPRSGCSSRSPPSCTTAPPSRSGRSLAVARRLPPAVRLDARHAHRTRSCSAACSCRSASRSIRRAGRIGRAGRARGPSADAAIRCTQPLGSTSTRPPGPRLGELPLARRDVERLRLILGLQRRLRDVDREPARAARARAPQHLPRGADVARDSRRRAGARRALEGAARRRRANAGDAGRGTAEHRAPSRAAATAAPPPARRDDADRRVDAGAVTRHATVAASNRRQAASLRRRLLRSSCTASRASAAISSLMSGHAGSISLARKLNFGLRGYPWWLLCSPSPPVTSASSADVGGGVVEVLVADVMAQPVDRRRQHEHVHHRVNARREQRPADADHRPTRAARRCRRRGRAGRG